MVLGYVITPVGLRVEFLWNDALYSTKTHCDVLDVIIELTISEICARYDGAEMVEVSWGRFAPNSQFLDELKKEIKPIVRKQFESCDGKMKRLLAKQG